MSVYASTVQTYNCGCYVTLVIDWLMWTDSGKTTLAMKVYKCVGIYENVGIFEDYK